MVCLPILLLEILRCTRVNAGMLRINVPFAGKFEERDLLVGFLRKEVLNKRSDILFIHIYVPRPNRDFLF